jgi:hypothetical protein
VQRALRLFRQLGLIETRYGCVKILNIKGLRDLLRRADAER